jgi:hypothetical protein
MRCICRTASTSALLIEDENRGFCSSTRRDFELVIIGELSPFSGAIVERIKPATQRLALPGWNGINGSPCAADVAYRQTGLRDQCVNPVSKRPW